MVFKKILTLALLIYFVRNACCKYSCSCSHYSNSAKCSANATTTDLCFACNNTDCDTVKTVNFTSPSECLADNITACCPSVTTVYVNSEFLCQCYCSLEAFGFQIISSSSQFECVCNNDSSSTAKALTVASSTSTDLNSSSKFGSTKSTNVASVSNPTKVTSPQSARTSSVSNTVFDFTTETKLVSKKSTKISSMSNSVSDFGSTKTFYDNIPSYDNTSNRYNEIVLIFEIIVGLLEILIILITALYCVCKYCTKSTLTQCVFTDFHHQIQKTSRTKIDIRKEIVCIPSSSINPVVDKVQLDFSSVQSIAFDKTKESIV